MKKLLMISAVLVLLTSCGGGNDGDAATDGTNMPMDTALAQDTAGTMNRNTGSYPVDSNSLGDDSISPSSTQSRSTTPRNAGNTKDDNQ